MNYEHEAQDIFLEIQELTSTLQFEVEINIPNTEIKIKKKLKTFPRLYQPQNILMCLKKFKLVANYVN